MSPLRGSSLRVAALAAILLVGAALALWSGYELAPRLLVRDGGAGGAPSEFARDFFALQILKKPRPLPPIAFSDAAGHRLSLVDFRGRAVLLNLWATWCVPCRKEMPALDRLEAKLGGPGFIVVPLAIDGAEASAVARFYRAVGVKRLATYLAGSRDLSSRLGVPGVPTSFLIDPEGREVARKIGPADWDSAQMIALVRRYLPARAGREARQ